MTYEEMERFIFGDNTQPIPLSWRDEVVKLAMRFDKERRHELLTILVIMARVERQKMNENILDHLGLVVTA